MIIRYSLGVTLSLIMGIMAVIPSTAYAHVKWFAPYDTKAPPVSLEELFTPTFFWIGFASVLFVFAMSYVDSYTGVLNQYINRYRHQLHQKLPEKFGYLFLRNTLIVFFVCIWTLGGVVLTPELKHDSTLVLAVQVLIIASLFMEKTSKFAGVGIIMLWTYGAINYGVFHVSDYMIFLGIAVFMLIGNQQHNTRQSAIAYLILYCGISITLQWASVEKWLYPNWSFPVLEEREYLTMGIDKGVYMIIAGYVEFALAFLLIAIAGSAFILTTISLAIVFILAIIDFGKVDAIGHLAIIVALFLMALKGPSRINVFFSSLDADPARNALKVSACYVLSMTFFTLLYYALQFIWARYAA